MTTRNTLAAALLGPRESEVDCDDCFQLLDRYVDEVAAGADPVQAHPRMHAHLRGCPVCQEEFETLHTLVTTDSIDSGGFA